MATLFGSTPAKPLFGGLSSGTSATTTPAPTFGTSQPGGSLFGSNALSTPAAQMVAASGFGSFGATQQTPSQGAGQQGSSLPQSSIGPMTSFGDLPKDAQDAMRQLESRINEMSSKLQTVGHEHKEQIDAMQALVKLREDVAQSVATTAHKVKDDRYAIERIRAEAGKDLRDAEICEREADNDRRSNRPNPFERYQHELLQEYLDRMQRYKSAIEELERDLASVQASQPLHTQALTNIMRSQHDAFLAVASRIAASHTHVEALRDEWKEYCRRNNIQNDPLQARRLERERERGNVAPGPRFGGARQGFDPNKLATLGLPNPSLAITAAPAAQQGAVPNAAPQATPIKPGGLFGNTATAPATGGMFGNTNAAQPTGGMFGNTAASQSAGGMFGNTNTGQATGGLFGSSNTGQPAGGMFGNTATGQSTGGMLGNANTGQATGGLFGNTNTAPATGGMFGNTNTAQSTGGMFGNTGAAQSTGLFGSTPASTSANPAAGGLFGNTTSSTAPTSGGLFGSTASAAPAAGGLFGSSQPAAGGLFGGASTPATGFAGFGAAGAK